MLALSHAELTGQGQHVDVSMMEAVVVGLENAPSSTIWRRLFGTGTVASSR